MSALEKYSVTPLPGRHLPATPASLAGVAGAQDEACPLTIRLAERLLPGAVFVLELAGAGAPRVWPAGVMGRRVSLEPLARLLFERTPADEEQWVDAISGHPVLGRLLPVREAGPLGFASVPLGSEGGRFGALREAGPWSEDDRSLLRDLALSFARDLQRARPRSDERTSQVDTPEGAALDAASTTPPRQDRLASLTPLLRGLCHELNNPLTSIKSFAELLLLDARSEEDREALEIVQREAHRAARIVGDLRMVARQSAESSMARELVDLNALIRQVLDGRRQELRVERITVVEQLEPQLPPVRAVRTHLEHVISHLVTNAIGSLEGWTGRREITLVTAASASGVRFSVRDSGRGIVPDHLGRMERMPGGDGASVDTFNLGLSLVESIVTHHGGRMEASGRVDQGAVIAVELPNEQVEASESLVGEESSASRSLRVLIVDEEVPVRSSLARYLERRGHQVDQASDGPSSLRMINGGKGEPGYDIVVADLGIPDFAGGRLLQCLEEESSSLQQRLILMTAEPIEAPLPEGAAAGIPLLRKPFELAEVAQVIESQASLELE